MAHKKSRLAQRILDAAGSGERYRDVHVFIGGTGAVGGTALLKLIDLYEEMFAIRKPEPEDVPILVCTGMGDKDIKAFQKRLFRWTQSRWGKDCLPEEIRNGCMTHSGVFVAFERLRIQLLPGLAEVATARPDELGALIERYLAKIGTHAGDDPARIRDAVAQAMRAERPLSEFLGRYRRKYEYLAKRGSGFRYRSVVVGIPLPSLVAYHGDSIRALCDAVRLGEERRAELVRVFEAAVRDDVAAIQGTTADHVLIAHTTAVGGMFDARRGRLVPRMGFAHSPVDLHLAAKQRAAMEFTELYKEKKVPMLITAAAIGVDEVQVNKPARMARRINELLFEHPRPLFSGSQEPLQSSAPGVIAAGHPMPAPKVVRRIRPATVPLRGGEAADLEFDRGEEIRPSYVIRSGENGDFSIANADALYRVMRVASASELGNVLATTGLLGDDDEDPWFDDEGICYYTETENARQVFDFVGQPSLRAAQLDGLNPQSLQDLGDARHQGELHLLGLLILRHRLRSLDVDAIPPYVDLPSFDPGTFFRQCSSPLLFDNVAQWTVGEIAQDLQTLATAESPEALEPLCSFKAGSHAELFPSKAKAREQVLETVLHAVWNIPSLGTPFVVERDGRTWVRTGYYAAPLDCLISTTADYGDRLEEFHRESGSGCDLQTFTDYVLTVRGFIDLRPHAVITWAPSPADVTRENTVRVQTTEQMREVMQRIPYYSVFATGGLVATLFRLHALHDELGQAMVELGTLQDARWQMPRTETGHILMVPGIVEAFRHVSEGLEKVTGTDRLAGFWGYERRVPPDRRGEIPMD